MYENSLQPKEMQERYQELPPQITELFEYGTVSSVLDATAREFGLKEEQRVALRMEIELVLYLFLPKTGLIERLQDSLKINQSLAEQLTAKIEGEIFLLISDLLDFAEEQFREETTTTSDNKREVTSSSTNEEKSFIPKEIVTENKTPNSVETEEPKEEGVKSIRTFAEDMEVSRAHSYGAFRSNDEETDGDDPIHQTNQDDILKK